jgi:hypothetical protein
MHREYCRKHGREYYYFCPECARDKKQKELKRKWDEMVARTVWLPEVTNPMLLSVKMFLADMINKVNQAYDHDEHNCAHFAKEIQDSASQRGIRCGYVLISFKESETGHAVVAFETDYGLKFFEPQSAEEQDVLIGRCYLAQAKGTPENVISKIEITWNDGQKTIIDK